VLGVVAAGVERAGATAVVVFAVEVVVVAELDVLLDVAAPGTPALPVEPVPVPVPVSGTKLKMAVAQSVGAVVTTESIPGWPL
jgi:hypothetical protein